MAELSSSEEMKRRFLWRWWVGVVSESETSDEEDGGGEW